MSSMDSPQTAGNLPADAKAAELRAAIKAEDYEGAGRLIAQLMEAFAVRPVTSRPGEELRGLADTMSLLLWARKTVMANRAHLRAKLDQVEHVTRYRSPGSAGRSRTWLMHG